MEMERQAARESIDKATKLREKALKKRCGPYDPGGVRVPVCVRLVLLVLAVVRLLLSPCSMRLVFCLTSWPSSCLSLSRSRSPNLKCRRCRGRSAKSRERVRRASKSTEDYRAAKASVRQSHQEYR